MKHQYRSTTRRKDTRDRFKERMQNRTITKSPFLKPWYRQRHNFFPLLMLFVFIVLILIVKAVYNVQNSPIEETTVIEQPINDQEPMDYETAKKIFGG